MTKKLIIPGAIKDQIKEFTPISLRMQKENGQFHFRRNRIEISTVFGNKGLTISEEDFGFFGKMETDFSLRLSDRISL